MAERDLDVVVFGATGVTGRRVAAYLAERAPETGARWAAAARDAAKLERVLGEDGVSGAETIAADLDDPDSLAAMASRARVVLNLVGPYTLYGRPVIEACVAAGAHYVDLTGEIPFVRQVIDDFDARATEAGVKVVQVCGFEALPPDLAVLLATESARERWDEGLVEADLDVSVQGPPGLPHPSDVISGGTAQSVAAIAGSEDPSGVTDPGALITDSATAGEVRRRSPISVAPRRSGDAVIAPMAPAAFINPAVIQRTAALLAAERGDKAEPFRYREGFALRGGTATLPLRYAAAGALSGVQALLASATRARPSVRRRVGSALGAVLPSSGFGPAADRLESWRWSMSLRTRTAGGHEVRIEVDADGHPGYLATARMLGEAGLLLAEPDATPERAGCLTPATALGTAGIDRFDRARARFSVKA
ncbi:MAG TPA: saccharopine dehydrogenase NADP-binding domain-containing protein [Solirubrobacterales bacterium]|nr:saccharopine dehydrogenase NADP-binding domain-containing protein [Solirubrobacterales bacterium]